MSTQISKEMGNSSVPDNTEYATPKTPVAQEWRKNQLRQRKPVLSAMIVVSAVSGLQPLDPALHSLALPAAATELGMDPSTTSFVKSLSTIVLAACLLGVGLLGDRVGRRKAMVFGVALMGFAAVIAILSVAPWMLAVSRVIMGIGTAISFSMCLAFVPTLYSKTELPKAFSMFFAIGSVIVMTGTSASGYFQNLLSWRASYALTAILCVIFGTAAWAMLPENKAAHLRRFDGLGVVLSAIGLVLLVSSLGRATTFGWTHPSVLLGLAASFIVLAVFVAWERKVEDPGFPVSLFKIPTFAAACLAGVLFNWADASLLGQVPDLAIPAGVSSSLVSVVIAGMYLGMMCGSVAAGVAQKRFGLSNRTMFTSGMLMCATALGSQFWVNDAQNLLLPGFGLFLVGFSVMWMQNPQSAVILGSAPSDQAGAVGAIKPAVGQLGFGLGFAVAAPLASIYGDGTGVLTAHSYGMGLFTQSWVFVLAAIAMFILLSPKNLARQNSRA